MAGPTHPVKDSDAKKVIGTSRRMEHPTTRGNDALGPARRRLQGLDPDSSVRCDAGSPRQRQERGLATWAEFEAAAPQLAGKGRTLLYQYGPPLGYLATVRGDGGPRVHPFCPIVAEGGLWAYILRRSPKGADLRRDPRFALHAFSPKDVDDEFFVRGHAERIQPTADLKAAIVSAALPATVGADEEDLFQLHIDRVLIASYTHRGQWPPSYQRWASPGG